jgi:proline racemase
MRRWKRRRSVTAPGGTTVPGTAWPSASSHFDRQPGRRGRAAGRARLGLPTTSQQLGETGRVQAATDGATEVTIDVPSGRVVARVHTEAGRVSAVDFVNVASYLLAQDIEVATSRGRVLVDIGFGGAIYAQLRADRVGLAVVPEQVNELLAIGREIKWLLNDSPHAQHPSDDRLSGIYGTIVFEELGTAGDGSLHQRNVTIFADGEVDRSPCGSGWRSWTPVGSLGRAGAGARLDRRLQLHLHDRRLADR